ncbi:hypothetical protein [uncultured Methanobrevibacter sp.]|uniref:hypothetical protein n=1 Tax=uncultured Methanobrevibacter sp. TaxID=253161 RepID=UPI0026004622|nr:hypothetical protein [uncultured Methanobrevibacter sp.]MDO5809709.1 hypothetical protein [Methanobrevibacter sp.]
MEYLFALFIIIIIACGMLFFTQASLSSSFNIEDAASHRLILDEVANQISQVNSNGEGYSKMIHLPSDKGYFELTIHKNRLIMEYDDKKGETLLPLANIDSNEKLISGRSYIITKTDEGLVIA